MRVALMIEGQEGVTWEQWVALARACEENGVETLFRSDHYISQSNETGNVAHDAWTTLAGLAGSSGSADGTGSEARFFYPAGVAVDSLDHVWIVQRPRSLTDDEKGATLSPPRMPAISCAVFGADVARVTQITSRSNPS